MDDEELDRARLVCGARISGLATGLSCQLDKGHVLRGDGHRCGSLSWNLSKEECVYLSDRAKFDAAKVHIRALIRSISCGERWAESQAQIDARLWLEEQEYHG